jgi:hypothetical protein
MTCTLGSLTIAAGSRAEPCRLVSSAASRQVQVSPLVRAAAPGVFDRGNASFEDVVEVDHTYATPAQAAAGLAARRAAALAAPKAALSYGGTAAGTAIVTGVSLVEQVGAGLTLQYKLTGVYP